VVVLVSVLSTVHLCI